MATQELVQYLSQFVSERRLSLINEVLQNRTKYITVALENIYQPQNASAVLRTCECLGIQDIHVIENENKYVYNPCVALGAGKWTNLIRYNKPGNNSLHAISHLKENGYRIVVTVPEERGIALDDFDISKGRTAIIIGTELHGVSETAIAAADEFLTIPMYGFTESYNLSVSTALILYQLVRKLRTSDIDWHLSDDEITELRFSWLKSSIKRPELLIKNFRENLTLLGHQ